MLAITDYWGESESINVIAFDRNKYLTVVRNHTQQICCVKVGYCSNHMGKKIKLIDLLMLPTEINGAPRTKHQAYNEYRKYHRKVTKYSIFGDYVDHQYKSIKKSIDKFNRIKRDAYLTRHISKGYGFSSQCLVAKDIDGVFIYRSSKKKTTIKSHRIDFSMF